jgi:TM2 domain-containing membrane protein YozV
VNPALPDEDVFEHRRRTPAGSLGLLIGLSGLLAHALDDGMLSLDDPACSRPDVTIHHVVSMTAGIPKESGMGCQDTFLFAPGTDFAYSDGIDNDGNGVADFPADPGCSALADGPEGDRINPPPVADAGPDQVVVRDALVTLDASGSADFEGAIASYLWEQLSGPTLTFSDEAAINPSFVAPDPGSTNATRPLSNVFTTTHPGHPGSCQPSNRSYTTAVILSSIFGFVGVRHFYLGRWIEGVLDVGLSIVWIVSFFRGNFILGVVFAAADILHAFVVTIVLLTGNYRDGDGRVVCYPVQKLTIHRG